MTAAGDVPVYRRDGATWTAFGALFAFGVANAMLGPTLLYLRRAEHISYTVGGLHQAAFAIGGLSAGMLAARASTRDARTSDAGLSAPASTSDARRRDARTPGSRRRAVAGGLTGAAVAGIGLGYGPDLGVTLVAALAVGFFATTALIRVWAALADQHRQNRAVAMTEGEVAVSFAGVLTPLVIGGLAASALSWRFAFVVAAAVLVIAAATALLGPAGAAGPAGPAGSAGSTPVAGPAQTPVRAGRAPRRTLVVIFAIVALEFTLSFWAASYLHDDVGLPRRTAVTLVSGLYAANLAGRLLASRLARRVAPVPLLAAALVVAFLAMPALLSAHGATSAGFGVALAGLGIGATFPLASALHVGASDLTADAALGEILTVAGIGEIVGPVVAGVLAQAWNLRVGLLTMPALIVIGAVGLGVVARTARRAATPS